MWITIPFKYYLKAPATFWITVASVSCVLFEFRNYIKLLSSFETPVPEDKKCKKIIELNDSKYSKNQKQKFCARNTFRKYFATPYALL